MPYPTIYLNVVKSDDFVFAESGTPSSEVFLHHIKLWNRKFENTIQ